MIFPTTTRSRLRFAVVGQPADVEREVKALHEEHGDRLWEVHRTGLLGGRLLVQLSGVPEPRPP